MKEKKSKNILSVSKRMAGFAFIPVVVFFLAGTVAVIAGVEGSRGAFRSTASLTHAATSTSFVKPLATSTKQSAIMPLKAENSKASTTQVIKAKKAARTSTVSNINSSAVAGVIASDKNISFPYAVQAGRGGIDFENGYVDGDMYSAGSIDACGTCVVTGNAISETSISGKSRWEQFKVISAQADSISYVAATSSLSCNAAVFNNVNCTSLKPLFAQTPITDASVLGWKTSAAASAYSGNMYVDYRGATLGNRKIVGNLFVSDGGVLRLSGPVWVTGRIYISDGATVVNESGAKSTVIISDGAISLSGGSNVKTGRTGNVLLISTSTADPAITLTGGTTNSVLFAPNGGILVKGGAKAISLYGRHVVLDEGSSVMYDPVSANLDLSL